MEKNRIIANSFGITIDSDTIENGIFKNIALDKVHILFSKANNKLADRGYVTKLLNHIFINCSIDVLTIRSKFTPMYLDNNFLKKLPVKKLHLENVGFIESKCLMYADLSALSITNLTTLNIGCEHTLNIPKNFLKNCNNIFELSLSSLYCYKYSDSKKTFVLHEGFLSGKKLASISLQDCDLSKCSLSNLCVTGEISFDHCWLSQKILSNSTVGHINIVDTYCTPNILSKTLVLNSARLMSLKKVGPNFLKRTFDSDKPISLSLGVWEEYKDFKLLNGKKFKTLGFDKIVNPTVDYLVGTRCRLLRAFIVKDKNMDAKAFTKTLFSAVSFRYKIVKARNKPDFSYDFEIDKPFYDNGVSINLRFNRYAYVSKFYFDGLTIYKTKEAPNNLSYMATLTRDGLTYEEHSVSIHKAVESLLATHGLSDTFVYAQNKYPNGYLFTLEEAIGVYRLVTGACKSGVYHFVESRNLDKDRKYSYDDIVKIVSEGKSYGYELFANFVTEMKDGKIPTASAKLDIYKSYMNFVDTIKDL